MGQTVRISKCREILWPSHKVPVKVKRLVPARNCHFPSTMACFPVNSVIALEEKFPVVPAVIFKVLGVVVFGSYVWLETLIWNSRRKGCQNTFFCSPIIDNLCRILAANIEHPTPLLTRKGIKRRTLGETVGSYSTLIQGRETLQCHRAYSGTQFVESHNLCHILAANIIPCFCWQEMIFLYLTCHIRLLSE